MSVEHVQAQVARMVDLAWAAGVLDARGSFTTSVRAGKPGQYQPRILFRPDAGYREPLSEALQDVLGGTVTHAGSRRNQRSIWSVGGAKACLEVDELLLPFMRLKARRVQMHALLCDVMVDWKPASFEERALPADEVLRRQRIVDSMSRL